MKYYYPIPIDHFEYATIDNATERASLATLDGTPRASSWTEVTITLGAADHRQASRVADMPWLRWGLLLMRRRARLALEPVLDACGEFLPARTADAQTLTIFHPTKIVNALDLPSSKVSFVPGTSRIMTVDNAVFLVNKIVGVQAFRIPIATSNLYVTEHVVNAAEASKLTGIEFRLA